MWIFLQTLGVEHSSRQRIFYKTGHMMTKWPMPVANCEKVLVRLVLNVCVDDEGVLVHFVGIGWDASFLSTVGKSHDVLKKVIYFILSSLLGFQILLYEIIDAAGPETLSCRARFLFWSWC